MNDPVAGLGGRAERPAPARATLLEKGTVLREQMLYSNNYTFAVELGDHGAERCLAIYKPRDGEAPLRDFPESTLYRREYLSYLVSEALGWGLIPRTIIREGPYGIGTMQEFVYAQKGMHYFNLLPSHRPQMVRIAVLDCLVNNTDRKGGHTLADAGGRIWAIDHGLTFSAGPKLRTVMWHLVEEILDPEIKEQVAALRSHPALRDAVIEHLSRPEVDAFYKRMDLIAGSSLIPMRALADPYKPTPWPII